ncbi:hypothetical protein LRD18_11915 [Halorhodospira halochloris]|uniref:hypothetical protein n=1 Tax=Halorhodospira halochloris TaxID=1052 RepID=UPI001EE7CB42|nr:hypothetical protein [Halorhodospira halochloris]MCG5531550.1 hypothetical protein [Halorhodospira halochloris]
MSREQVRFAVAMRMDGPDSAGAEPSEFADLLGVAKSTVARTETMEMAMRADTLMTMLRVLREHGVELDLRAARRGRTRIENCLRGVAHVKR